MPSRGPLRGGHGTVHRDERGGHVGGAETLSQAAAAPAGAARHQAWVITDSGTVAGFAIAARKSSGGAEILWIAVDAARRGRGHGTTLLGHVLDHLGADGISVVEAKTLDRSSGYRPYEATRAFWERNGFVHVDTIDPLPGWEPGNPAAIYVAALRPTR